MGCLLEKKILYIEIESAEGMGLEKWSEVESRQTPDKPPRLGEHPFHSLSPTVLKMLTHY